VRLWGGPNALSRCRGQRSLYSAPYGSKYCKPYSRPYSCKSSFTYSAGRPSIMAVRLAVCTEIQYCRSMQAGCTVIHMYSHTGSCTKSDSVAGPSLRTLRSVCPTTVRLFVCTQRKYRRTSQSPTSVRMYSNTAKRTQSHTVPVGRFALLGWSSPSWLYGWVYVQPYRRAQSRPGFTRDKPLRTTEVITELGERPRTSPGDPATTAQISNSFANSSPSLSSTRARAYLPSASYPTVEKRTSVRLGSRAIEEGGEPIPMGLRSRRTSDRGFRRKTWTFSARISSNSAVVSSAS